MKAERFAPCPRRCAATTENQPPIHGSDNPYRCNSENPVYTCKKRIFAHRRSSDGTTPRRGSCYQKSSHIFQLKTRRNEAENTPFFERRSFYET